MAAEYHARRHDTTGRVPREHWLAELSSLRSVSRHKNLAEVFLHREKRTVRKDGTVRWNGGLVEVRAGLEGEEVELRFNPSDPHTNPRVFVDGVFVCDTVPLDRVANAARRRRRLREPAAPEVQPSGLDPLALIEAEHYDRIRPVDAPQDQKKTKKPQPTRSEP